MIIRRLLLPLLILGAVVCIHAGCRVKYSFSGTSIPAAAQTFSIAMFQNNAAMVAPTLASELTDALIERFERQTRLNQVPADMVGDFSFEGEITNYVSAPALISGSDDKATTNRLTVTVNVRFINAIEPEFSFPERGRTFSSYADYDVNIDLMDAEDSLLPDIIDELVTEIFNATASNW